MQDQMPISLRLWNENIKLAESSYSSAFVDGIKDGNLPINNFKDYIAQDAYFLEAFAKAYGMAIFKSPDTKTIKVLGNLLEGVIKELELHNSYAKTWGVNLNEYSINQATKEYIDFLLEISNKGKMIEIIAAMTPCMRLYAWIGQTITKSCINGNNKYSQWIDIYSDNEFEILAITLEDLININYEDHLLDSIRSLYSKAMKLELKFFNAYSP